MTDEKMGLSPETRDAIVIALTGPSGGDGCFDVGWMPFLVKVLEESLRLDDALKATTEELEQTKREHGELIAAIDPEGAEENHAERLVWCKELLTAERMAGTVHDLEDRARNAERECIDHRKTKDRLFDIEKECTTSNRLLASYAKRLEQAERDRAATQMRANIVLTYKNYWADRARKAERKLTALREKVGRIARRARMLSEVPIDVPQAQWQGRLAEIATELTEPESGAPERGGGEAGSDAPLSDSPPSPKGDGEVGQEPSPIPMVLHCPNCDEQHIDAPEPGTDWDNPPHKSHLCHACGCIWRPADVPTDGVASIKTRGKADTWPIQEPSPPHCSKCGGELCPVIEDWGCGIMGHSILKKFRYHHADNDGTPANERCARPQPAPFAE